MTEAARYRALAQECRQLAWATTTRQTVDALLEMAAEYDVKAQELRKRNQQLANC